MRKQLSALCPLSILLANSCAMAALFTVFSMVEGLGKSDPCLSLWLCCLSACQLAMSLFLRRERSQRALIYFCAAFFVLQLVLAFVLYGRFSSVIGMLAAVCMWLYSYFNCFELHIKTPPVERYTKSFDVCSLVLIFVLFFCSVKKLPFSLVVPLALSALSCLMAQVLVRGGDGRKLRSSLMSAAIILLMGAAAAGFVALASGGLQKLVSGIINCVYLVLAFFYRCINAVFRFLMRLVPEKQYDSFAPPELPGIDTSGVEQEAMAFLDPEKIIIAVLCIGLAIAAALIIHRIISGKNTVTAATVGGDKDVHRRRSGLFAALKKAAAKLIKALRFKLICLLSGSTAPGLFVQIEKHSRPKLGGRGEGESCREFLRRAEGIYPHASNELKTLANALDELYFGSGKTMSPDEVKKIRLVIFERNE